VTIINSWRRYFLENKSPSAIAVTIVAAIAAARADSRAAAIAGVRTYESVPLYAVPL